MSLAKHKAINASSSGATELIPADAGKSYLVIGYTVVAGGPVTVKFQSGTTDITGPITLSAAGDGGSVYNSEGGVFSTAKGEALNINLSAAATVGGHITYIEIEQ